jgi:hypothetical protein
MENKNLHNSVLPEKGVERSDELTDIGHHQIQPRDTLENDINNFLTDFIQIKRNIKKVLIFGS